MTEYAYTTGTAATSTIYIKYDSDDTADLFSFLDSDSSWLERMNREEEVQKYVLKMKEFDSKYPDYSHNKAPLHWKGWRSRR